MSYHPVDIADHIGEEERQRRERFKTLRGAISQLTLRNAAHPEIRAWVPGCGSGEAAYWLSMLLCEQTVVSARGASFHIVATDTDVERLGRAREGRFPASTMQTLSVQRRQRFFQLDAQGYGVRSLIRQPILFALHDAVRDTPFPQIDMVYCPHLFAEAGHESQFSLLRAFHAALSPNGVLCLGTLNTSPPSIASAGIAAIDDRQWFEPIDIRRGLYRAKPEATFSLTTAIPDGLPEATPDILVDLTPQRQTSKENIVDATQDSSRASHQDALTALNATLSATNETLRSELAQAKRMYIDLQSLMASKEVEQQLHDSEARMQWIARSTHDYAIITFDMQGYLTSWNRGAETMFGYSESEVIGQYGAMLFSSADCAQGIFEHEMRQAQLHGRAEDNRWMRRKDSTALFCNGILLVLESPDGVAHGFAKIARDTTKRQRLKQLREKRMNREKAVRQAIEASNHLKDKFLAIMSHELKHPLTLIGVNVELLSRNPLIRQQPVITRAIHAIGEAVKSQAKIIDDLLDLSRVNTGKLRLNKQQIDAVQCVQSIVNAASEAASIKDIALTFEHTHASIPMIADPVRFEQIVWNLISNALKFTPRQGMVGVVLREEDGGVRLDVQDSGVGIEPHFLPHVFDLFRQSIDATNRVETGGGLGIGLSLVRELVEAHGGNIQAASDGLGHGTRMTARFPPQTLAPDQSTTMPHGAAFNELRDKRVLLVDDSEPLLEAFGELLSLEGAIVATATSGTAALCMAESQQFDIVVSDLGMPDMDGYAFMRIFRARHIAPAPMAIAMTGFGLARDAELSMAAGFDAHLAKPTTLADLAGVIREIDERRSLLNKPVSV